MKKFSELSSKQKKNHLKILKKLILPGDVFWVRGEVSFRMVERMHKAGIVHAFVSKYNWFGNGSRPFKELAICFDNTTYEGYPSLPSFGIHK